MSRRTAHRLFAGAALTAISANLTPVTLAAAHATPAAGQDSLNDWGRSAEQIAAAVTAAVDANPAVQKARASLARSQAQLAAADKALQSAELAYKQATGTKAKTDDKAARKRLALASSARSKAASGLTAAQAACDTAVAAAEAAARAVRYVRAPQLATPAAPAGIAVSVTGASVGITWDAVPAASTYRVLRDGLPIAVTDTPGYVDTDIAPGIAYEYQIVAVNKAGWSRPSSLQVITPSDAAPAAPAAPSASSPQSGSIRLSWEPVSSAGSYRIYRDGALVASSRGTEITDTGLQDARSYTYRVVACNGDLCSDPSDATDATPVAATPAAPTGLASLGGSRSITVTWKQASGATSYTVYRDGAAVATVPTATYTDTDVQDQVNYRYTVTATRLNSGPSPASAALVASTGIPTLAAPAVTANAGDGRATFTWPAVPGAAGYRIVKNGTVAVSSTQATSTTFYGLDNGVPVAVSVTALGVTGKSNTSSPSASATATPQPAAPSSLTATPSDRSITVRWRGPISATGYRILRDGVPLATVTATSYTDESVANAVEHIYTVVTISGKGQSSPSEPIVATAAGPALETVTGVVATAGTRQVTLRWNALDDATSYQVYRSVNGVKTLVTTVTQASYLDTGLTAGVSYSYTIVAVGSAADYSPSAPSTAVTARPLPDAPASVLASAGNAQVLLEWTAVDDATSYRVYRNGLQIASPTTTRYVDTGRTNGTTYTYTVVAVAGSYASAASLPTSAVPRATSLTAPTDLAAAGADGSTTLTWAPVSGATIYKVYRDAALLAASTTATYTDTTPTPGQAHVYTVVAVDSSGSSSASSPSNAALGMASPAQPAAPTAQADGGDIHLTWSAVPGATSYLVIRDGVTLGTAQQAAYTDTTGQAGTTYSYAIAARAGGTTSVTSPASTASPSAPALPAPAGLAASPRTQSVALTWTAVAGADGYDVYRDGELIIHTVEAAATDLDAAPGVVRAYQVVATGPAPLRPSNRTPAVTAAGLPAPVQDLAAEPRVNTVALAWTAVPGATSYQVWRDGSLVAVSTGASYQDTGRSPGLVHSYTVRTVAGDSLAPASSPVKAAAAAQRLPSPGNVTARADSHAITVTWSPVTGATGYRVYRGATIVGYPTGTAFTDTGLVDDVPLTYTVVAVGTAPQNAPSAPSLPVIATASSSPAVGPARLDVTTADSAIQLSWPAAAGAASYLLYRDGALIGATADLSYRDTGRVNGTPHTYAVVGVTGTGPTRPSPTRTAVATAAALPAPADLTATPAVARVDLTWAAVPGAAEYRVLRDGAVLATTRTPAYQDTGTPAGMPRAYAVLAVGVAGTPDSPTSSAVTAAAIPPTPGALSLEPADGQVTVRWAPLPGVTYRLYRDGALLWSGSQASYTDTGLVNGQSHAYAVQSVALDTSSPLSSSRTSAAGIAPLEPPTVVRAVAGSRSITVIWDAVTGAASYGVHIATDSGLQLVCTTASTSCTLDALTPGTATAIHVTAHPAGVTSSPARPSAPVTATALPPSPTAPQATAGSGQVSLAWQPVADATGYRILRDGVTLATTASATYTDTTAVNGTTYAYAVAALAGTTASAPSPAVRATPTGVLLPAPSGVTATGSARTITVAWTAVPQATGYRVYRDGIAVGQVTAAVYADTNLAAGIAHSYTVVALGDATTTPSHPSTVVTTIALPGTPTSVSAAAGNAQVTLSWDAVADAESYRIYRDGVQVASTPTPGYIDTALTNTVRYTYTITAVILDTESAASSPVSATPSVTATSTPTGLTGTPSTGQVSLTWNAVTGATGYRIYRGGALLGTSTSPAYVDTAATPGTAYSYTVTATSAGAAESPASAAVTATALPATPTGLAASAGNAQVTVTWTAVAGATGYRVYRGATLIASPTTATWTDTGLVNGTAYSYTVVAVAGTAASSPTAAVTATPSLALSAPTSVTASAAANQVTVTWTAVAGATGYRVYRGATLIASPTTATWTDTGLTAGTAYSYTVVAVADTVTSPASAAVTATALPATPTGLAASAGNAQVTVTWTAVAGATGYRVYRGATLIASPTTATWTDTGLVNGTAYSYTVVAVAGTAASSPTAAVTATPAKPLVNGTFTGAVTAIAKGHGTLKVTITLTNSVITSATGTLLTYDSRETLSINNGALPKYASETVAANSATIAKVSGATLTYAAFVSSLQSALTQSGR